MTPHGLHVAICKHGDRYYWYTCDGLKSHSGDEDSLGGALAEISVALNICVDCDGPLFRDGRRCQCENDD